MSIQAIHLEAPIISAEQKAISIRNQWFEQWIAPNERAGGWLTNSAPLGVVGNTVIAGHHNEYGKVFGHMVELKAGDLIYLFSGEKKFTYEVVDTQLLPEKDVSLDIRKANAVWISPTDDERVTFVTCWPKRNNTHRVIIVAKPVIILEK